MSEFASGPLTLTQRSSTPPPGAPEPWLRLCLGADERFRLRGHRRSACGRDLVLQLERGEPLQPGEWLSGAPGDPPVRVEAAAEPLLVVRASDPLDLLRAAYHLGNRHVALEVCAGELRLLEDSVLADLLEQRGLALERCQAPFLPEAGAYAAAGGHRHGPGHDHDHDHDPGRGLDHDHDPSPADHPTHG
ncbi:MAG: urease accessory protein UreE [Cyanobacteria bacterium]|nr:urease accessory protein UreE [Cyanobacteriota bacterium]